MTTDNLIEELTRRQTKAMALEREHGLEGLITLSIDEAAAILSALKENKRLREALTDLADAVTREVNSPDHRGGSGFLLARLSDARAALQPQGEK